jgi:hypothetical protein
MSWLQRAAEALEDALDWDDDPPAMAGEDVDDDQLEASP